MLSENSDHGSAINMVSEDKENGVEIFLMLHNTQGSQTLALPAAVCGGERPGALEVSPDQTSHTAELGGASRKDPQCHRGEPVPQHVALAASAGPEHPQPRDPLCFRHPWEKGVHSCGCDLMQHLKSCLYHHLITCILSQAEYRY